MLTVDFSRLDVGPGMTLLDVGCGPGRHAAEAFRRGVAVTALDHNAEEVRKTRDLLAAMIAADEAPPGTGFEALVGDATHLPFAPASFDRVIVSEVLEHITNDRPAIAEIARVLKPGGRAAVTVPRWWPEQVCWAISKAYRSAPGGHVRVYRSAQLAESLARAGLEIEAREHAHALHAPYWWLKCAVGLDREDALVVRQYHRFLVWDIVKRPRWVRTLERSLDPVLGKSLVFYVAKAAAAQAAA